MTSPIWKYHADAVADGYLRGAVCATVDLADREVA